jgi:hypothetical protein
MLISLDDVVKKYGILFTGILHIGAHECEEIVFYDKYIGRDKVLWIDAISDKVEYSKQLHKDILIENAVVSDVSEELTFNTTTTITRDILKKYDIKFNFINLDIQGAVINALRGMEEYLQNIDYIYAKDCALLNEIDDYLKNFGFVRKELGDAFYVKEKCYVSCNICGGLGNQMFQIACTYALSLEHDLMPIFKKMDSSPSIFKNRSVYFDSIFKKIKVINDEEINNINFTKIEEGTQNYKKINLETNNSYLLNGYFQSPKYFKECKSQIMNLFELEENKMNHIKNYYNNINKQNQKTVSVHVRRGDYLALSHFHNNLSIDYYKNAIKYFDDECLYVIFSDDVEWCKNNFNMQNIYFVENISNEFEIPNDVFELFLMSMCDNNIIANSSFSAWAAYLNKNESKKVIAPRKWFVPPINNDQISDIYDDNWIIIYGLNVIK